MQRRLMRHLWISLCLALGLSGTHAASARPLPDRFDVGRDVTGEPCIASRDWSAQGGTVKIEGNQPFALTCRGVSAARLQGLVAPAATATPATARRLCGESRAVSLTGLPGATARQCHDPALGLQVVELNVAGRHGRVVGAAVPSALSPLVQMLRATATGAQPGSARIAAPCPIDLTSLPPIPASTAPPGDRSEFDPDSALQQGVLLMRSGRNAEASRVINDALSRLNEDAAPALLAELQMTAALAESDLGQFAAADAGFTAAARTLGAHAAIEGAAYLQDELRTYQALDAVNQRQWQRVLDLLGTTAGTAFPLLDPVTLSQLNRRSGKAGDAALSLKDKSQFYWLMFDVQKHYAKSIALLALDRLPDARAALEGPGGAADIFTALEQLAQPASLNWLRASIQLQHARILARMKMADAALAAYDCTILTLQGLPQAPGPDCPLASATPGTAAAVDGPTIANVQLERAATASAKTGARADLVSAEYDRAITTLQSFGRSASAQPPALIFYLDLLLREAADHPSEEVNERFFRTLQAVGDPAIAGDMAKLANVVASDGKIGAKIRDRAELERRITQLRYQISDLPGNDAAQRHALEQQRVAAEAELVALNTDLAKNSRVVAQSDSVVPLAEMRAALHSGEVYLKIVLIRDRLFGFAVNNSKSYAYSLDLTAQDLDELVHIVLASAHSHERGEGGGKGGGGARQIDPFDVETSYALFRAVAGPAYADLVRARAIIFDPSGPLRTLPAGIFVTDADSVRRYRVTARSDPYNFSGVNFLAARSNLAMALSPRSFLVVRTKVAPSTAALPFLGLGENAPSPAIAPDLARTPVLFGPGCSISYGTWAAIKNGNPPINAHQLTVAAEAFGVPDAPRITDAAFSDVGIAAASQSGELSRYQVLHFATHGLPQMPIVADGCATSLPPSLVATMVPPTGAAGAQSDGLLTFAKIATLNLNANLVVLSACETSASTDVVAIRRGSGGEEASGALDGLVRAFFTANARAVLATYWRVPATTQSEELMDAFYRTGRSASIGEALRMAQTTLIAQPRFSHPYYWGAYFVVGDTTKTMLTGTTPAADPKGN